MKSSTRVDVKTPDTNSSCPKVDSDNRRGSSSPQVVDRSPQPACSVPQRTDALLRGLDLILEHHGAPGPVRDALKSQCHSYLDDAKAEGVWLKRCKYLLTYPLARHLRNDLPPQPDKVFKPSGCLRGWMKARLNAFNPRNVHLWYSWLQAKRSTLPLSDEVVSKTYEDHLQSLTRDDPGDFDVIHEIFKDRTFTSLLNDLSRKMKEMSESFETNKKHFLTSNPKNSACFTATRSQGGQKSALRDLCGLPTYKPDDDSVLSTSDDLYSMIYRPRVHTKHGELYNFCQSVYCPQGYQDWLTLVDCTIDLSKPLNCTIQAVLEPNKVRVISKGEALPYYFCKKVQELLHGHLRDLPCFRLLGRPISPTDILDVKEKAQGDWEWFSIDYSAATDGLSWSYSKAILTYILKDVPHTNPIVDLVLRVLGPHNLYYPEGKEVVMKGTQSNGQLMGSILSFPILCLANLGLYLLVTKEMRSGWTKEESLRHVLINGDDMVYAAPRSLWERHVDLGRKIGLEMSVGKAYVHREYLNINSQSFLFPLHRPGVETTVIDLDEVVYDDDGFSGVKHYRQVHRCCGDPSCRKEYCTIDHRRVKMVNFLNCGLYFGQHKTQGGHNDLKLAASHHLESGGIVENINTLLTGSLPGKESELLTSLLVRQSDSILKECMVKIRTGSKRQIVRNLFIPKFLGGMGVCPPQGFRWKVTKDQLRLASGILHEKPSMEIATQYPLPGYEVEDFSEDKAVPWSLDTEKDDNLYLPSRTITYGALRRLCRGPDCIPYDTVRNALYYRGPSKRSLRKAYHFGCSLALQDLLESALLL